MKKAIVALSVILISAFVVILAVNAQNGPQENKKSCTEMSKSGTKCPAAASCCKMKYGSTAQAKTCDQSKCKEKGCDPANCKEGKCDKANCKTACTAAPCAAKKCDQAKASPGSVN
jgi:hypothetical protein